MRELDKEYLGDGVYARANAGVIILTVENGSTYPLHTIILEPDILRALMEYVKRAEEA